ncbi:MAG: hypothetical protein AAFX76_02135 [Planctomycetota bacterium]
MPDAAHRVRLEGVDFAAAFPTLRLFDSFRMALQPSKLTLGLVLLLLVYFGGVALDLMWGTQTREGFGGVEVEYRVFGETLDRELAYFNQLVNSAVRLDFGVGALASGTPGITPGSGTINSGGGLIGALRGMVVETPGWLWSTHPFFFVLLVGYAAALAAVIGGAIARLAATQACADTTTGLGEAWRFTWPRTGWFLVSPLIPLGVAGAFWLVLAAVGGALFNVAGLNVAGGVLFGPMIFAGLVAAVLLILVALGGPMLPSALAVEGTDAFDVVSRVSTFLLYRPVRMLALIAAAVTYGALTYLVVGLVVFLALWFTRAAAGAWGSGLEAVMVEPRLGEPLATPGSDLGSTEQATSWLIRVWSGLWFGLSIAYVVSYFFTAQTWMYLLLRRSTEGTDFADYAPEPEDRVTVGASMEKVEPSGDGAGEEEEAGMEAEDGDEGK